MRAAQVTRIRPGLILLGWALFGVFFGLHNRLVLTYRNPDVPWWAGIAPWLLHAGIWAALSFGIVWLLRRYPLARPSLRRGLVVHIPASIVVAFLQLLLYEFTISVLGIREPAQTFWGHMAVIVVAFAHRNVLVYWFVVAAVLGLDYYAKYRERELQAARLETQLAQAQLRVLKMQLDPHFLFNTLNSISSLMRKDPDAADSMLEGLSQLLRMSLAREAQQLVSLREELEFLELYLGIQAVRFGDRLTVRFNVDVETLDAAVPHMILQPAVENAIKHGVAPLVSEARLLIETVRSDGYVVIRVSDNGPGFPHQPWVQEGLGLQNTRRRLEALYGSDFEFEATNGSGSGVSVTFRIPFRSVPDEAPVPAGAGGCD